MYECVMMRNELIFVGRVYYLYIYLTINNANNGFKNHQLTGTRIYDQ